MIDEKKTQELFGQVTGKAMETMTVWADANQREMERVFQEWASRSGWGAMMPSAARAEAKRDGEPEADRLREEVASLRERLRSLEERLEKRKSQAK